MLARCSAEFMYWVNIASAEEVSPRATFSEYVVQLGLPCDSSCAPRLGLCDSACAEAMCAVQFAATVDVPEVTVSDRRPCWARAWLMSVTSRLPNADGVDSAAAEGASAAATPSSAMKMAPAVSRTRMVLTPPLDYDLITHSD